MLRCGARYGVRSIVLTSWRIGADDEKVGARRHALRWCPIPARQHHDVLPWRRRTVRGRAHAQCTGPRAFWHESVRSRTLRHARAGERDDELRRNHHRDRASGTVAHAAAGGLRHESRDHRTRSLRRHLRQHGMHAHQDAGRERLCRAYGTARCRLRFQHRGRGQGRHEARQGAERLRRRFLQPRCRAIAQEPRELHRLPGPRALRVAARG